MFNYQNHLSSHSLLCTHLALSCVSINRAFVGYQAYWNVCFCLLVARGLWSGLGTWCHQAQHWKNITRWCCLSQLTARGSLALPAPWSTGVGECSHPPGLMSGTLTATVTNNSSCLWVLLNVFCKQTHPTPQQLRGADVYTPASTDLSHPGKQELMEARGPGFIVQTRKFEPGLFCIRALDLKGVNFSGPFPQLWNDGLSGGLRK